MKDVERRLDLGRSGQKTQEQEDAVIAALEFLNEHDMELDAVLRFDRETDGRWVTDAARTMRDAAGGCGRDGRAG